MDCVQTDVSDLPQLCSPPEKEQTCSPPTSAGEATQSLSRVGLPSQMPSGRTQNLSDTSLNSTDDLKERLNVAQLAPGSPQNLSDTSKISPDSSKTSSQIPLDTTKAFLDSSKTSSQISSDTTKAFPDSSQIPSDTTKAFPDSSKTSSQIPSDTTKASPDSSKTSSQIPSDITKGSPGSLKASPSAAQKPSAVVKEPLSTDDYCIVCFVFNVTQQTTEHCCRANVCRACMRRVVSTKVNDGNVQIPCPNPKCDKYIHKEDVIKFIGSDKELRNKYDRFLVDAGEDSSQKTCPRCCAITKHVMPRKLRLTEEDVKLRCTSCDLEWCFQCHAPWHAGLACKTFKKGDKQFQDWTKGKRLQGDANCRQCPTCRVYIQRNDGCDHMTCSRCESEFCYKCGGVYLIPEIGNYMHHMRLSIVGCEYNYTGSTSERRALRGSYLAAMIASLTGYPFLFAGGVALLLGVGIVVVPIYVGYRFYRYHKNTSKCRVKRR